MMNLYSPWALILLALLPLAGLLMYRRRTEAAIRFGSLRDVGRLKPTWRGRGRFLLKVARLLCLALLIVALARPRHGITMENVSTRGVVMQLVVDRSGSMGQKMQYDGQPMTRLAVVKKVLHDFVQGGNGLPGRPNDLMGLITFARYPDTLCPLVRAHDALLGFLNQTEVVTQRSEDGTAIGDAIALAAARLKKAEEEITRRNAKLKIVGGVEAASRIKPEFTIKSKVIILLTDGDNNAGDYLPEKAADLARQWGIKIYTIGVGGPSEVQTLLGTFPVDDLNERLLQYIARYTGGFYSRANNGQALRQICAKIDKLEKSQIESVEYSRYEERFTWWALAALIVLAGEIIGSCTIFRKIP